MDIFVLASHREGFPRSAMEAAAMGVPIVATDIRGCRQVVDHGVTGLLVPPGDVVALGSAVAQLAGDPQLRARMSVAARERAGRLFDQQRCVDTTLSVYQRLLHQRGIAAPVASTR
jgi:glycosyltransferase involved in cell wall biosynthesis